MRKRRSIVAVLREKENDTLNELFSSRAIPLFIVIETTFAVILALALRIVALLVCIYDVTTLFIHYLFRQQCLYVVFISSRLTFAFAHALLYYQPLFITLCRLLRRVSHWHICIFETKRKFLFPNIKKKKNKKDYRFTD